MDAKIGLETHRFESKFGCVIRIGNLLITSNRNSDAKIRIENPITKTEN